MIEKGATIAEPKGKLGVLLVGMGAVLGGMVISLYLPMFKVITLIK